VPDLSRMRRNYDGRLREEDLAATWVEQFDRWFADAVAAELPEPNAVVVATADADGAPDARIVLMKGYDEAGLIFAPATPPRRGRSWRSTRERPWSSPGTDAAPGAGGRTGGADR
jgi:pyridoxamine 5'-phosphate oxidase